MIGHTVEYVQACMMFVHVFNILSVIYDFTIELVCLYIGMSEACIFRYFKTDEEYQLLGFYNLDSIVMNNFLVSKSIDEKTK